jgi:hypothetical protein
VLRLVLLSIVLTLAAGQNAALLCKVWCDPHEAPASGCHHQHAPTFPSATAGDHCNDVVLNVPAFVREDERPRVSAPDVQHALAGPRFQFAPPLTVTRPGNPPGQDWLLERRPLVTALRI